MNSDSLTRSTRRELTQRLFSAFLGLALAPGCARHKSREAVLSALFDDLAQADGACVRTASAELGASLRGAPLLQAREHFREALRAWKTAACLPGGPLVRNHALLRALYWPVRTGAVEQLVTSSRPLDQALVNDLGVDQKGLYSIELLLFGTGAGSLPLVEQPGRSGDRARALALAYAENLAACVDVPATKEASPPGASVLLTRLLSHLTTLLGSISSGRLSKALLPAGDVRPNEVEGYASGSSRAILATLITAMERIYLGHTGVGLTTIVGESRPDCDGRVRALFKDAREALERIESPAELHGLEALSRARHAVRRLDVAIETELTSALGVTLLFAGNDAD